MWSDVCHALHGRYGHAILNPIPREWLMLLELLLNPLKALVLEMAHTGLQKKPKKTKGEKATKYCGVNKIWFAEAD